MQIRFVFVCICLAYYVDSNGGSVGSKARLAGQPCILRTGQQSQIPRWWIAKKKSTLCPMLIVRYAWSTAYGRWDIGYWWIRQSGIKNLTVTYSNFATGKSGRLLSIGMFPRVRMLTYSGQPMLLNHEKPWTVKFSRKEIWSFRPGIKSWLLKDNYRGLIYKPFKKL